jgi:pyridoxal phosphate enzyme (YggS family)
MSSITDNLVQVHSRIALACKHSNRNPDEITLIAVSKKHRSEKIREAFRAGQQSFGENYVQEGIEKITELSDIRNQLIWHFIGPLQSNKTRLIAENFDWVQSVDRIKIAHRLSEQRPSNLPPLNICLQVNISKEETKSGVDLEDALNTCLELVTLPNLSLRGLMAIPKPDETLETIQSFKQIFVSIQTHLNTYQFKNNFDTLSIGMSDDLEMSIAGGSTMIRVGTAIFGSR